MARRGRPKKQGERHKCGKLRSVRDNGTERIHEMRNRYGIHYNSALGRAYAAGLLGDRAEDLYHGGKTFSRIYRRVIGGFEYRCPLNQTPRGSESMDFEITARDQHEHDWLHDVLNALDRTGLREWLDQLASIHYIDMDPPWLSRLLSGGKDPADKQALKNAIAALEVVSPQERRQIILVA